MDPEMNQDQDYSMQMQNNESAYGEPSQPNQAQGQFKRPRGASDEENSECKRAKFASDIKTDLRILVASKDGGAIIGKGGFNIKRLRQEYSASVLLPDSNGPERVMLISTTLGDACAILLEVMNAMHPGGHEANMKFLIHQSQAGAVIGKGGFKIKELREQCGAHIKVYTECAPGSTDRVVEIGGHPEVIATTVLTMMEFLQSAPPIGQNYPYDPMNFDASFEYGGFADVDTRSGVRGRGGMPRSRAPMQRGGGGGFGQSMRGGSPRGGRGGPARGGGMQMRGPSRPMTFGTSRYDMPSRGGMRGGFPAPRGRGGRGGMPMRGGGSRGGGFADYGYKSFEDEGMGNPESLMNMGGHDDSELMNSGDGYEDVESTQVSIPNELAGCIIGKGGQRIKQVRADSGAEITIADPSPDNQDRIISIKGTASQIQAAQYMLQMSVKQFSGKY